MISDYLTTQGRISVIKHLLDIEKTIISQAQQYANLCDKGIKVISVKIDPTISFEEAKIQERVTQSKAVKNIIDKGDQE